MRSDITKVFTEEKGYGGRATLKKKWARNQKKDGLGSVETSVNHIGMGRGPGYKNHPGRNLNPLRRFLERNLGKKWNDLWSEICQHADARTKAGADMRDLVKQITGQTDEHSSYISPFIIRDGILIRQTKKKWVRPDYDRADLLEHGSIITVHGKQYHLHRGNWYRVQMQPVPRTVNIYHHFDSKQVLDAFFTKEELERGQFRSTGEKLQAKYGRHFSAHEILEAKYGRTVNGEFQYCAWKQAASKKEIKQIKAYQEQTI